MSKPRFIMPAEWEPHAATWLTWPHNPTDWPGKTSAIHWVYAEIVRKLTPGEIVCLLVLNKSHELRAAKFLHDAGVDLDRVAFHRIPTNRSWVRDYGPIFVRPKGRKTCSAALGFQFTGWARYTACVKDAKATAAIARGADRAFVPVDLVLEGGSIDVNGKGRLLTTEECLLDAKVQARNPGRSQKDIETLLHQHLGAEEVIWLGKGIAGDDTHGHVDDLCRFVKVDTVVLAQETNPRDVNHRPLRENAERLQSVRGLQVVPLPMPAPLHFRGMRLPASYANFLIANQTVLVPTFNDPKDRVALGILGELFPDREVVGIHAVDLVLGQGAIHCLTMQQPA